MTEIENCHSCGAESDWYCERCEQCVCEKCTVPFTQMNQIDYTLCSDCNDTYHEIRAEEEYLETLTPSQEKKYYRDKSLIGKMIVLAKQKFGIIK